MIAIDGFDRTHSEFLMKTAVRGRETLTFASWHGGPFDRLGLASAFLKALPAGTADCLASPGIAGVIIDAAILPKAAVPANFAGHLDLVFW